MSTGLALPLGATNGRAILSNGEDQLRKIIILALSDCDNANPFQDLGIDTHIIFSIDNHEDKGVIRRHVKNVFARLQADGRAKLMDGFPTFKQEKEAEISVTVRYINLKTTKPGEINLRGASVAGIFKGY